MWNQLLRDGDEFFSGSFCLLCIAILNGVEFQIIAQAVCGSTAVMNESASAFCCWSKYGKKTCEGCEYR